MEFGNQTAVIFLTHPFQVSESKDRHVNQGMKQKAKGFLRLLHDRSVIYYANLLTDVLEPLKRLSLSFRSVCATVEF